MDIGKQNSTAYISDHFMPTDGQNYVSFAYHVYINEYEITITIKKPYSCS